MPPATKPPNTLANWLALGGLIAAVIAALVAWPMAAGLVILFCVISITVGTCQHREWLRRLAVERRGEDIGTFARGFDRRSEPFDPWVVRATWDALEPYVVFRGGRVPLRATDRFWGLDALPVDPDDIEDLLKEVAARSGRSLDQLEAN